MKTSYRQILVHFDDTRRSAGRLALARRIAAEHGAAVAALYATMGLTLQLPYGPEVGAGVLAALQQLEQERQFAAKGRFEDVLGTPGPRATWAVANEFPVAGSFLQQALYADLLVLGQRDPADPDAAGVPRDFVETVVIGSGKPALVVPYAGGVPAQFHTVLLAWKESREAARALTAAMPLLQRAARVIVLSWGGNGPWVKGSHLDLRDYLRLHGVQAEWHRQPEAEPRELGELLLSRAADLSAELLVMGCFGHSRAREWVLGGVTRTVMASMTLPVLMAH